MKVIQLVLALTILFSVESLATAKGPTGSKDQQSRPEDFEPESCQISLKVDSVEVARALLQAMLQILDGLPGPAAESRRSCVRLALNKLPSAN